MFMVVDTLRVPSILCSKVYGTRSVPTTMHWLILICEQIYQNYRKLNNPEYIAFLLDLC